MTINIIHLNEQQVSDKYPTWIEAQQKRKQSFMDQMAIQRARYKVHDGFVERPVFKAIAKSHKNIVRIAKESNLPMVAIMEDDCIFTHQGSYKYFLSRMPKEFDLYFGLIYHGTIGEDHRVLNGFSGGMTLYIVHQRFYETFLNVKEDFHIDNRLGELASDHKYFVCDPYVCYQAGGYSYNHRKVLYYDEYLKGRQLFNG